MHTILFDLDGTLVDSSPGILQGYQLVLQTYNLQPKVEVGTHLIGPPLAQTLAIITGETEPAALSKLVECFKQVYDSEGYKATQAYPDLKEALTALVNNGYDLVLVTNKRRIPTLKTLEWFDILSLFKAIYTPDTWQPAVTRKNDTMGKAIAELGLNPAQCFMVGDSTDDAHAAADHGVAFIAANYGYGDAATQTVYPTVGTIGGLGELLGFLSGQSSH